MLRDGIWSVINRVVPYDNSGPPPAGLEATSSSGTHSAWDFIPSSNPTLTNSTSTPDRGFYPAPQSIA